MSINYTIWFTQFPMHTSVLALQVEMHVFFYPLDTDVLVYENALEFKTFYAPHKINPHLPLPSPSHSYNLQPVTFCHQGIA